MLESQPILEFCLGLTSFAETNLKNPNTYLEYSEITLDIPLYVILVSLRKRNKITDERTVWHQSRPSGLVTQIHPLGQFAHNNRIQLNRLEDWDSSSSAKMCTEQSKNCHCHFIFPEKKFVNTEPFRTSEWLWIYKNCQKNKSIIVIISLQRVLPG